MPDLQSSILANLFRISQKRLDEQYQTMINDLDNEIAGYRAMRMDDKAIYDILMSDFEQEKGVFGRFKGAIESDMDELVVRTTQSEQVANNPAEQLYNWVLDPTVNEHCTDCLERAAMGSQTMLFWSSRGIPGSGATKCADYCCCMLDEVLEEVNESNQ
jgi:hypothetical protein